jgi:predicted nucleic acid-binding protein
MEIVYLETTFFSFYFDERTAPTIVAMREWTRQFWSERRGGYNLVTSPAALEELRKGGVYHKEAALSMALTIPIVLSRGEVTRIAQTYIDHKLMPGNIAGDALHLALASFHNCDYLVTWNCRHLANANKFGHIRKINRQLGLNTPDLVTPLEMLGESEL